MCSYKCPWGFTFTLREVNYDPIFLMKKQDGTSATAHLLALTACAAEESFLSPLDTSPPDQVCLRFCHLPWGSNVELW